jgi:hypothetical protein
MARTEEEQAIVSRVYGDPDRRALVQAATQQPLAQAVDALLSLLAEEHLAGWHEGAGWQQR